MTDEEFQMLDGYKAKKVQFSYQFTYNDLPDECPDDLGRLIRKTDSEQSRWLSWQKSVQRASNHSAVSREVMDYFQQTKHLVRPPRKEDLNIMGTAPLGLETQTETPRFTWSPSKLMSFETCPAKFAAESYYKTVPYQETVHTIWGTRVHKQAELAMLNEECEDLEAYVVVRDYVRVLKQLPGQRLVEYQISLDENWKPCEWAEGTARMIVDLAIISPDGKSLKCYDWKTGKIKDDPIQMQIYSYCLAIMFPDVQDFDFKYIWLKDKTTTGFKLNRADLLPVAKDVRTRVARMKQAWDNENFNMRKNGLCKQWCGNKACPYSGGR